MVQYIGTVATLYEDMHLLHMGLQWHDWVKLGGWDFHLCLRVCARFGVTVSVCVICPGSALLDTVVTYVLHIWHSSIDDICSMFF